MGIDPCNSMKQKYIILTIIALAFSLFGCETTTQTEEEAVTLTKGMTTDEIVAAMGDPIEIIPTNIYQGRGEAWTFKKIITTTSQTASHTIEIPYIDPITQERKIINEPVLEMHATKHRFLTTLYVLDGKLIGWKQTKNTNNSIGG